MHAHNHRITIQMIRGQFISSTTQFSEHSCVAIAPDQQTKRNISVNKIILFLANA